MNEAVETQDSEEDSAVIQPGTARHEEEREIDVSDGVCYVWEALEDQEEVEEVDRVVERRQARCPLRHLASKTQASLEQ